MNNGKKDTIQITLNSLVFSLIICLNFFTFVFGEVLGSGGMVYILAVICLLLSINIAYIHSLKISSVWFFSIVGLTFFYILSEHTKLEGIEFFCYIIIPGIAAICAINIEKTIKYATYFSLILLMFINKILPVLSGKDINKAEQGVMGLSYAILPILIAGFIHYIYYREKSNFLIKICYAIDIIYIIIMFLYGNRGAVLTLIIAFVVLYIKKFGYKSTKNATIYRIFIVIILSYIAYISYIPILEWLNGFFQSNNIRLDFIQKTLRLADDASNGRSEINEYVIYNIKKLPVSGHGISSIAYYTNGLIPYPHNFILQLLYDGGIILAAPVLFVVYRMISYAIWSENCDKTAFIVLFILVCLPKMFFSTDMWKNPSFCLFVFNYLNFYSLYSHKRQEEKTE